MQNQDLHIKNNKKTDASGSTLALAVFWGLDVMDSEQGVSVQPYSPQVNKCSQR